MKLGIIGCGKIAPFHLFSMQKAGFELHSISGTYNSKNALYLKKKFNINKIFSSSKLHIRSKEYDALLFLTPHEVTCKYLLEVDTSIKVLAEKPITFYSKKLKKIKNKNIKIAFNRRQYKSIEIIKSEINKNKIFFIEVSIPENINFLKNKKQLLNNKNFREKYFNIFYNSIHIFDLIKYMAGNYTVSSIKHLKGNANSLDGYIICINSHKVKKIIIKSVFNASENFSLVAYSKEARFVLNPLESLSIYKGMHIIEPNSEFPLRRYEPIKVSHNNETVSLNSKPGFIKQANSFYDFCKNKKSNLANLEDLIDAIHLAEKIFKQVDD